MKLREIIKMTAAMLQLDDILTLSELYNQNYDLTSESTLYVNVDNTITEEKLLTLRDLACLIRSFNLIYKEIATEYMPLIFKETITITNEEYSLSGLSNTFYKDISLVNDSNEKVRYSIINNKLLANNGTYTLTYCYIPNNASLNTEIESFDGRINERIFTLGTASEYLLAGSDYETGQMYEEKYKNSLKVVAQNKRTMKMPKRRWQ